MTARATKPDGLAAYIAVTAAYWAFMLSDGALRMLVLLHFHSLGFSPVQLAWLFLLYEFMGMVTNLSAGWIAARFGLTSTLYAGLGLQIAALVALAQLDPGWSVVGSVIFVMAVQGASGVAKDLAKMSSKSAVKLLAPTGEGALFRWVAVLTGSKNAVKGLGFLLGAALLGVLGFTAAVYAMAAVLATILAGVALFMPAGLPRGRKGAKFREVFSKDPRINRLSAARMFLFGARDVWFVVGVPIYFYAVLSDGTEAGNRAAFFQIGTFMALWVIGYGAVQAWAPKLLGAAGKPLSQIVRLAAVWVGALTLIPLALAAAAWAAGGPQGWLTGVLVAGLMLFGVVFALNSAVHSYLILAFTEAERVTMDVGFYYMSNAAGRLLGTLLSGLSYQIGGLPLCLATAGAMAGLSFLIVRRLEG
ncbi:organoarsenical effux MFS transporter ArsJ [Actibacterium sp. MT2.3-13A]|uniref:organoarsenical effux MFS transporter ArsJ n=1 Tax=Actibacterium sp. MT2.3-13A TaxID=2828332 RepID=UPI001BA7B420|nr:organoarsenical effux MFS transporter ArsJ [Actibacterium sp. MT2.3-13A]